MSQTFEDLLADFQSAKAKAMAAAARAKKAAEKRDAKFAAIKDVCSPVCKKAIETFNITQGGATARIVFERLRMGFDFEKKHLTLGLELRYPGGGAPYDEFDFENTKRYFDALGAILNPLLADASIPLTLGHIDFPSSYYLK